MDFHERNRRTMRKPRTNRLTVSTVEQKKLFFEYAENSTINGIRYIGGRRRHWSERTFWMIAIGSSLAFCCYLFIRVIEKWNENPVITTFGETPISIDEIPLPAITICPRLKEGVFVENYFGRDMTLENYVESDAVIQLCESNALNPGNGKFGYRNNFNSTLVDWIEQHTNHSENVIVASAQEGRLNNARSLTQYGFCWTFNSLNAHELYTNAISKDFVRFAHNLSADRWSLDAGYRYQVDADTPAYPYNGSIKMNLAPGSQKRKAANCRGSQIRFKVAIHSPVEPVHEITEFSFINLSGYMTFVIGARIKNISNDLRSYGWDIRQCYFPNERQLRFFRIYTQRNCELECWANRMKSECECVPFFMPRDDSTAICGSYNRRVCYEKILAYQQPNCNCLPACTSIAYTYKVLENRDLQLLLQRRNGYEYSKIMVMFGDKQFISLQRSVLYGLTDFIAYCGGVLGLCFGISLLSIVEFLYYFTLICRARHRRRPPPNIRAIEIIEMTSDLPN